MLFDPDRVHVGWLSADLANFKFDQAPIDGCDDAHDRGYTVHAILKKSPRTHVVIRQGAREPDNTDFVADFHA